MSTKYDGEGLGFLSFALIISCLILASAIADEIKATDYRHCLDRMDNGHIESCTQPF